MGFSFTRMGDHIVSESAPATESAESTTEEATTSEASSGAYDPVAEVEKWKAYARKHEGRAKDNFEKAKKYDELLAKEEAGKANAEVVAARKEAESAQRENAMLRAANTHRLPSELMSVLEHVPAGLMEEAAKTLAKYVAKPMPGIGQGVGEPAQPKQDMNAAIRSVRGY